MQIILNGLISGAAIALLAVAFQMVYLPTRVFFIGLAGIYSLAPFLVFAASEAGVPLAVGIVLAVATSVLVAVACEWLNHARLARKGASDGAHLISSLGIYILLAQLIAILWGNDTKTLRTVPIADDADWLKGCRVVDEDGNDLDRLRLDHVQQVYPPGQRCAVGGKLYRVDAHERDAVRLSKVSSSLRHLRPMRSVQVSTQDGRRTLAGGIPGHARSSIFERAVFELAFTVEHTGTGVAADPAKEWQIKRFAKPFRREYRTGRAVRLRLANEAGESWTPSQTLYLAQWINEAALTLFPESHRFLIATAAAEDSQRPSRRVTKQVIPALSFRHEDSWSCLPSGSYPAYQIPSPTP